MKILLFCSSFALVCFDAIMAMINFATGEPEFGLIYSALAIVAGIAFTIIGGETIWKE